MPYVLTVKPVKQPHRLRGNLFANHLVGTRSLLKKSGVWTLVEQTLTDEEIRAADRVFRGGYAYRLTDLDGLTVASEITSAGLASYVDLTPAA